MEWFSLAGLIGKVDHLHSLCSQAAQSTPMMSKEEEEPLSISMGRFQSTESLSSDDAPLSASKDEVAAVELMVAAFASRCQRSELDVLRRRLLCLLEDRESARSRRFLPLSEDRERFRHSLCSAAALLGSSAAVAEPEARFFFVQARRIVAELAGRLQDGTTVFPVVTVDETMDSHMRLQMEEPLNTAHIQEPLIQAEAAVGSATMGAWKEPEPQPEAQSCSAAGKRALRAAPTPRPIAKPISCLPFQRSATKSNNPPKSMAVANFPQKAVSFSLETDFGETAASEPVEREDDTTATDPAEEPLIPVAQLEDSERELVDAAEMRMLKAEARRIRRLKRSQRRAAKGTPSDDAPTPPSDQEEPSADFLPSELAEDIRASCGLSNDKEPDPPVPVNPKSPVSPAVVTYATAEITASSQDETTSTCGSDLHVTHSISLTEILMAESDIVGGGRSSPRRTRRHGYDYVDLSSSSDNHMEPLTERVGLGSAVRGVVAPRVLAHFPDAVRFAARIRSVSYPVEEGLEGERVRRPRKRPVFWAEVANGPAHFLVSNGRPTEKGTMMEERISEAVAASESSRPWQFSKFSLPNGDVGLGTWIPSVVDPNDACFARSPAFKPKPPPPPPEFARAPISLNILVASDAVPVMTLPIPNVQKVQTVKVPKST